MLRKLIKYEVKATARWFFPLYISIVLFAIINRFLLSFHFTANGNVNVLRVALTTISMLVYILLFMGTMIISLVVVIQRFYKNLLGDEGYLMFTLPVKTWQHIGSKLIIATLWNLLSGIVGFCSIMIIIPVGQMKNVLFALSTVSKIFNAPDLILFGVLLLASIARTVMEIYAAIALGHLFNKHRVLLSFAFYLGINTLSQVLFMLVLPFVYMPITNIIMADALSEITMKTEILPYGLIPQISTFSLFMLVITVIATAGYFIATNYLLKSRLNLE